MDQKEFTLVTPIVVKIGEEFASVQNPTLNYLEFVFTDDKANANKKGIPQSAFSHLIDTGILMPVKMADGEISRGHDNTVPIGVISHLDERQGEDRNQVVGKAALWSREHPDSVNLLKESYAAGDPLNMSWELLYTESSVDEDNNEWILDPVVRAITVVGAPAYQGRTPITTVASEDENMDELEQLKAQLEQVKAELEAKIAELNSALETANTELSSLREFKAEADRKDAEATLFSNRIAKLIESGIKYTDEELSAKRENLLKLSDEAFDYLVAELKDAVKEVASSTDEATQIPGPISRNDRSRMEVLKDGFKNLKL
jgi:hypothetical protein